ncbi:MAG: response regulator [Planctomycetota bacterium]|jgi:DNA-binding NarL/FixJ family response regulator
MDNEAKIRILLVDDNEVFRIFLRSILQKHFGMEVVGEAANGRMAVELVQEHRPDVVFMDVHMPGMNGIEATKCLLSARIWEGELLKRCLRLVPRATYLKAVQLRRSSPP